jgi:uroporphyrinogen-III synthase
LSKTVFITREAGTYPDIEAALRPLGAELLEASFIRTEAVSFATPTQEFQWVFFSSKQAVRAFFKQEKTHTQLRYAAVGEGTAEVLRAFAPVSFVGQSTDTEKVALAFAQQLGQELVLFPSSNISERTIQKAIPAVQVLEVTCYTTLETPIAVGHPDVLVFSSPSNVRAFFSANTLLYHQQIIAFGPTTAKQVAAYSSHSVQVLNIVDSNSILEAIKAALLC